MASFRAGGSYRDEVVRIRRGQRVVLMSKGGGGREAQGGGPGSGS